MRITELLDGRIEGDPQRRGVKRTGSPRGNKFKASTRKDYWWAGGRISTDALISFL